MGLRAGADFPVEYSLPDLRVLRRLPIEDGTGVHWGAGVRKIGDEVLLYGAADDGADKHPLLATTSATQPGTGWRYRTADRTWLPQSEAGRPVAERSEQ